MIIEDLAVTFHIEIGSYNDSNDSMSITNALATMWGISASELYDLAVKNLESANNGLFLTMKEVMFNIMLPDAIEFCNGDEDMARKVIDDAIPGDNRAYVLSNTDKINGACMILNKKMMREIANKIGPKFYILPSSVHELLVVRNEEGLTPEELSEMVRSVNSDVVDREEQLSDHAYVYTLGHGIRAV